MCQQWTMETSMNPGLPPPPSDLGQILWPIRQGQWYQPYLIPQAEQNNILNVEVTWKLQSTKQTGGVAISTFLGSRVSGCPKIDKSQELRGSDHLLREGVCWGAREGGAATTKLLPDMMKSEASSMKTGGSKTYLHKAEIKDRAEQKHCGINR